MDREIAIERRLGASGTLPTDQGMDDVVSRPDDHRTVSRRWRLAKRSDHAASLLDEKWDSLLECTPDLVVVVDRDGVILHVNHRPTKPSDDSEEVVGRSIYDFLEPQYHARVRESIERVFLTGETVRQVVCFAANGRGPLGSEAWIGPIKQKGRILAVGMFFADITELERLQTQLRDRETLLGSIVKAVPKMMEIVEGLVRHGADLDEPERRARELEFCRQQMVQIGRLASVSRAGSSLTQRLPQFLTAIGMSIENALAGLDAAASGNGVGKELKAALKAVEALTDGIEQVRCFSSTGSRQALIHFVDLHAILICTVKLMEVRARAVNTVICLNHLEALPQIRMAEGDAEQLFFSLIGSLLCLADGRTRHRIAISGGVRDHQIELCFSGDAGLVSRDHALQFAKPSSMAESVGEAVDLELLVASDIVAQAGGTLHCDGTAEAGPMCCVSLPVAESADSYEGI